MHILCVGISHRTAPVELRERLVMSDEAAAAVLKELHARYPAAELAALSTCNRTELYIVRPLHAHPRVDEVLEFLASSRQVEPARLTAAAYHHDNEKAIRHAMRVASGLDSMVLGEGQILGQFRHAYDLARSAGTVGKFLHTLFQSALAAGKRVRTETAIGHGRTSVSSVAVDFARHLFSRFDDKTLLVIGAGKMTELTLRHFAELRPGSLLVCNRTLERARELAAKFGGRAEPFERLAELLVEADIVISSTGSGRPIVTTEMFRPIARRRRGRPLFAIDIAVPRDIDPAVADSPNVYLYDMDDLQQAIAAESAARNGQVGACEAIIEAAVAQTYAAVQTSDYAALIQRLRRQLHDIGAAEARRTLNRLLAANQEEAEHILEEHTERVVNKILHRPLSELGKGSPTESAMNATALRRLFNLDEPQDLNLPDSPDAPEPGVHGH